MWSYTKARSDTGYTETSLQVWWYNTWTVSEETPDVPGMIKLKLETDTDLYSSWPYDIGTYYSDRISYAGTTITIRPQYRAGTGDHFVGYVEVPGEWSGKEVTFSVCRKSVTVTLGASPATASTITVGNGVFGTAVPIMLNTNVAGLLHTVTVSCLNQTETLQTQDAATSLSWTAALATYAPLLTTGKTAQATISCETFYNGTSIGTTTATITMTLPDTLAPTVATGWATAAPYNTGAVSGRSDWVQGYSAAEITFDSTKITCQSGATVSSYKIERNGTAVTSSPYRTSVISDTSTSITCTVIDSRGMTTSETLTVTLRPYQSPVVGSPDIFRCDNQGIEDEDGTYVSVEATAVTSALTGGNAYTLKAYIRASGGSYDSGHALTSGTASVLSGLNADVSYEIKVELTDALGNTATFLKTIPTQTWAMKFRSDGNGVAFGKAPEHNKELELPSDWMIRIGQKTLIDLFYPVGFHIVTSDVNFNPETQYPGTHWTQLTDVVIVAAGTTFPGGSSGGAASHSVDLSTGFANIGLSDDNALYTGADSPDSDGQTFTPTHAVQNAASWDYSPTGVTHARKTRLSGTANVNTMPPYVTRYVWQRTS